jgi:hypothetical protein
VEIQYHTFKDQKEWLPAKNVLDSKAPPTQYGENIVEEKALTRNGVNDIDAVRICWQRSEQAMF